MLVLDDYNFRVIINGLIGGPAIAPAEKSISLITRLKWW